MGNKAKIDSISLASRKNIFDNRIKHIECPAVMHPKKGDLPNPNN